MVHLGVQFVLFVRTCLFGAPCHAFHMFVLKKSQYGTPFIGSWDYMGFSGVNIYSVYLTAPAVSAIVFALYQLQFAMVTPAIIFGSVAERVRLLPSVFFIFCWATLVYDVCAYWTWSARGAKKGKKKKEEEEEEEEEQVFLKKNIQKDGCEICPA